MGFNDVLARIRVAATQLGKTGNTLVNVSGVLVGDKPEQAIGVPIWGALGLLARPRAPDADGTGASGFAARTADGLAPIALLDPRIARAVGPLAVGALALGGYLGQKVVLEDGALGGAKLSIVCGSLSIVIDTLAPGAPPGPSITLSNGGAVPCSITLGPDGKVALSGVALTFNGVPMQQP